MTRLLMTILAGAVLLAQFSDRVYLRTLTSAKSVEAVSVRDGTLVPLALETQEIVSAESVLQFSEDALVKIFNYRPGSAAEHVDSKAIRELFINEEAHETFKGAFLNWSAHEFNVNNISIKEAISHRGRLYQAPRSLNSGARIWRYSSSLPIMDRGVGSSNISQLNVQLSLVYLGPEGGMGIYKLRLTL